jgi:hypothetical protein
LATDDGYDVEPPRHVAQRISVAVGMGVNSLGPNPERESVRAGTLSYQSQVQQGIAINWSTGLVSVMILFEWWL